MVKDKTAKYFKYAIGEIILVVIGILIALQINNWNENRKDLFNEAKIVNTLHAEFKQNKKTLDTTLMLLIEAENALSFLLKDIKPNPNINFSPKELDNVLFKTISNPFRKRSEYTLRNLENSGKLSALSNEVLKMKIYGWSLVSTDITDKDSDATLGFNYLLKYYKENGSLRNLDAYGTQITEGRTALNYDHIKFFSDLVFENAVDDCLVFMRQRIEKYKKAMTIIDEILTITETKRV